MNLHQVRPGWRQLSRQRTFSATIVAILAMAIGANTAMFTLVDGVLLRPLPLRDPANLVTFAIVKPGTDRQPLSLPDFADFRTESQSLQQVAALFQWSVSLTGEGDAERLQGMRVSPDYFAATGSGVALGRAIHPADEHQPVALLSYGLWQRRFGGATNAIGQTLVLNGEAFTIAGVLARDFVSLVRDVDVVAPFSPSTDPRRANRAQAFLRVIGRVKPHMTTDQVAGDLDRVLQRLRIAFPNEHGSDTRVLVKPLHEEISGRFAPMLRMLFAAVALMLLVACANLANLFLLRGMQRRRELALRVTLGATRGRVLTLLVTEAGALAVAGGVLGLAVAHVLVKVLLAIGPSDLPRKAELAINGPVALFTLAVTLGACLLFGLAPALKVSRSEPRDALDGGGSRAVTSGHSRLRSTLVFAEVALCTLLLITTAVLARSFRNVTAVDPGFQPSNVLTLRLSLPRARYGSAAAIESFYQQLHPRLAALPGVRAVAAANVVPMNGYLATTSFRLDGMIPKDDPDAHYRMISADYFQALGVPLRSGRTFTAADRADSVPVAIVNEAFARTYWRGASPIGARLHLQDGGALVREVEIVGVTGDVRHFGREQDAAIEVFVPMAQVPDSTTIWLANNMYWIIETSDAPLAVANAVRHEIAGVDSGVPTSFVRSLDQWVDASIAPRRFNLRLVTSFGLSALLLAIVGVYGVSASSVAMRRREIGIRSSLGASRASIVRLLLRSSLSPVLIGLIAGAAAAALSGRALSGLLFGVRPHDPVSMAAVAFTLALAALVATYVPARRASREDPLIALHSE